MHIITIMEQSEQSAFASVEQREADWPGGGPQKFFQSRCTMSFRKLTHQAADANPYRHSKV